MQSDLPLESNLSVPQGFIYSTFLKGHNPQQFIPKDLVTTGIGACLGIAAFKVSTGEFAMAHLSYYSMPSEDFLDRLLGPEDAAASKISVTLVCNEAFQDCSSEPLQAMLLVLLNRGDISLTQYFNQGYSKLRIRCDDGEIEVARVREFLFEIDEKAQDRLYAVTMSLYEAREQGDELHTNHWDLWSIIDRSRRDLYADAAQALQPTVSSEIAPAVVPAQLSPTVVPVTPTSGEEITEQAPLPFVFLRIHSFISSNSSEMCRPVARRGAQLTASRAIIQRPHRSPSAIPSVIGQSSVRIRSMLPFPPGASGQASSSDSGEESKGEEFGDGMHSSDEGARASSRASAASSLLSDAVRDEGSLPPYSPPPFTFAGNLSHALG